MKVKEAGVRETKVLGRQAAGAGGGGGKKDSFFAVKLAR